MTMIYFCVDCGKKAPPNYEHSANTAQVVRNGCWVNVYYCDDCETARQIAADEAYCEEE